ncbi:unnamed protein product [Cylindrotheca closterium]|uniref:Uncharacterized protein n=1 Tax=Cylindrotheca closterium TaxID=2856 RepID=A0AAD2FWL5_9STRA|nr:unnamed protein product [Cylindrotheca closterium]
MGNIFSPSQPQTSLSASSPKSSVSPGDDKDTSAPNKGEAGPEDAESQQEVHPSQQNDATPPRPATRSIPKPRHSGRKRHKPTYLLISQRELASKKYAEESSNQADRNFVKDDDFKARRDEEHQGHEIFHDFLKPSGWRHTKTASLKSGFVFLAQGSSAETAEEGETKFYSYQDICRKWKSDKAFREMYEDAGSEDEADTTQTSSNRDRLGKPTPKEVPIAAGTPTKITEERRTAEETRGVTPKRKVRSKRGYSPSPTKRPRTTRSASKTTRSSSRY